MMDFYEALHLLLDQSANQPDTVKIPVTEACGRILTEDVYAQIDAPVFDNSAMDGYAVCDLQQDSWSIIETISAGDNSTTILKPGQAIRIFTGARIPQNTHAVIAQENTQVHNLILKATSVIKEQQNIRFQGEEIKKDTKILSAGTLLQPEAIGLLASQGFDCLNCFDVIKVTVFTTGDELICSTDAIKDSQIYDSNRPMLLAILKSCPYIYFQDGGILADDLTATTAALHTASLLSDCIVVSGGASVGDKDFVKPAITQLGEIEHWKLAIKPGKPFGWGHIHQCKIMLLPGNPVASFVTFKLLGLPALKRLAGIHTLQALPECFMAKADFTISPNTQKRREFLRGNLSFTGDGPKVTPVGKQGSHMLSSCVNANTLIDVPALTDIKEGDWITLYPL